MLSTLGACGSAPPVLVGLPVDPDVVAFLPSDTTSVVVVSPRRLFDETASRSLITRLVPDARLEALRAQHGIDARLLEQLVVASYEDGEIFLLRGPFRAEVAVAEIAHRMIPIESRSDAPRARAAGAFRGTRVDAIAIGPHTLALVAGPPALSGRLLSTLDGNSVPFDASEIRSLPREPPFLWLRPVPLVLPIDAPVAILLARERSMLITAAPVGSGSIALAVHMTGEFPPGAEANFRQLVESLAQTDLGRAVGMPSALVTLGVQAQESSVDLTAVLDAEGLARGLWLAMGAEIEEALTETPEPPR